jgi:hypothetical protein
MQRPVRRAGVFVAINPYVPRFQPGREKHPASARTREIQKNDTCRYALQVSFFWKFHARAVSRTEPFGSLVNLLPGEKVSLEESWELYDSLDQPFLPA